MNLEKNSLSSYRLSIYKFVQKKLNIKLRLIKRKNIYKVDILYFLKRILIKFYFENYLMYIISNQVIRVIQNFSNFFLFQINGKCIASSSSFLMSHRFVASRWFVN